MDNNQEQTKGGLKISLPSGFKLSGMVFVLDRDSPFFELVDDCRDSLAKCKNGLRFREKFK